MIVFTLTFVLISVLQIRADENNPVGDYGWNDYDIVSINYRLTCLDKKSRPIPFRYEFWIMEEDTFSDDEVNFYEGKADGIAQDQLHGHQYGDGVWDNEYEYYVRIKSDCSRTEDGFWQTYSRVLKPTCRVGSGQCEYMLNLDLKKD